MRRVKKTTNEQFDLLKAEMAIRPAAARGYGVGAQRAVVDAEWRDIVEKLNALGPPERTMTEWKKVWSDVRLRMKRQNMDKIIKSKKIKIKKAKKESIDPVEDQLMEALNSSISIYETNIKTEHSGGEGTPEASREYESCEGLDEEDSQLIENNYNYIENDTEDSKEKLRKSKQLQPEDNTIEHTLASVQKQLRHQSKLLNNLLEASSNMASLMNRFMRAEERKTSIMQRQLKVNEYHNVFLRRQQARRKFKYINLQAD